MRREPYKISSGILTLSVHLFFFGVLYLGLNWHEAQPEGMQVELWGQLPEAPTMPPAAAPAPPKAEPVKPQPQEVPAPAPPKPEIQLPGRKPKDKHEQKKMSKAQQRQAMEDMAAMEAQQDQNLASREQRDAAAARAAAARGAAISSEQEKYMGLISAKIRHNIVMPPELHENVEAKFVVTLLPDGSLVNDPRMVKSSGSAAYDAAVLRAILKSQPFPLPQDEDVRVRFINPNQIKLKFNSKDEQ